MASRVTIFVSETVKEDHIITFAPEPQALSEHVLSCTQVLKYETQDHEYYDFYGLKLMDTIAPIDSYSWIP